MWWFGRAVPVLLLAAISAIGPVDGGLETSFDSGFFANRGQVDPRVRFYGTSSRAAVYFTDYGPVIELREFVASEEGLAASGQALPRRSREQRRPGSTRRYAVGIRFVGASVPARVQPVGEAAGPRRYFIRGGVAVGATQVPVFERVVYRGVWPGIDIVYRAGPFGLEYQILAAPGADPSRVGAGFAARLLEIDAEVKRIIAGLQARGFKSPYLRTYVVARINPVRFHWAKKGQTTPPMALAAGLTRMAAAAKKFDLSSVRPGDLALVAAVATDSD